MDCWSSSLTVDEEFEKLVIRMNPPRYTIYYCYFGVNFSFIKRGSFNLSMGEEISRILPLMLVVQGYS